MRYKDVPENVTRIYNEVIETHFPNLVYAKILLLLDSKKKMSKGKLCLGYICKPNDFTKYLTKDMAPETGYDYIMFLNEVMVEHADNVDLERVIRHELRHCFYDVNSESNPYKIVDHDFTDFVAEIELNREDPTWCQRLGSLVSEIYEENR
jgi:hypothetical protein